MKRLLVILVIFIILIAIITGLYVYFEEDSMPLSSINNKPQIEQKEINQISFLSPSQSKILENNYHIFQTFNNCGPAALSMALSYYGISLSQADLGNSLRPYQVPGGNNDDKSVTLEELAQKAKDYDLIPYHRPNGNIEMIKLFITYDTPIIARTWTKPNEDIGHYRVIKGYDNITGEIIQDDSLQGKNLRYSYSDFNAIWKKFNYEYLVLVPKNKVSIVEKILGEDVDEKSAWQRAIRISESELQTDQTDIYARFNLSIALYNAGNYELSIQEFERIENQLPFRTLWYQIEPILAYQKLKNHKKVFELTDRILDNGNRAFSELYQIRGGVYSEQGNNNQAKIEFEKAVYFRKKT